MKRNTFEELSVRVTKLISPSDSHGKFHKRQQEVIWEGDFTLNPSFVVTNKVAIILSDSKRTLQLQTFLEDGGKMDLSSILAWKLQ